MTKWEQAKVAAIRYALEQNGGMIGKSGKWLGISSRSMTTYLRNYPDLMQFVAARSVSQYNKNCDRLAEIENIRIKEEDADIDELPQWYIDKYGKFLDEEDYTVKE